MLESSRFTTRPRDLCQHKGSPHLTPFAQKTVIPKVKYRLLVLVCMNEFNFCRKRLPVVVITSCLNPGIAWTQINARNKTRLRSNAAESACCEYEKVCRGLQTPGLFSEIHQFAYKNSCASLPDRCI